MDWQELASTNRNNKKLNLLTTKLRGVFACVLACVRGNFLVKSTNCVSVRVQKAKILDKNKLIKRAANCCSYIAFFSFLPVVFLAQWFVNFFLTFVKASTSYGYCHYVNYGIFTHWFSLDQMFKFSVSCATEVEKKNRPSHGCFNRDLRSTEDSKRATGHLSPPTNKVRDLKSLSLSCKTCILVHLNAWKV